MYKGSVRFSGATPERALAELRQALQLLEINLGSVDRYPISEDISISETEYVHLYARYCPDAPAVVA